MSLFCTAFEHQEIKSDPLVKNLVLCPTNFVGLKITNSPLKKGGRGILSPRNASGKDEIPPAPFARGGLLPDIKDWTEH